MQNNHLVPLVKRQLSAVLQELIDFQKYATSLMGGEELLKQHLFYKAHGIDTLDVQPILDQLSSISESLSKSQSLNDSTEMWRSLDKSHFRNDKSYAFSQGQHGNGHDLWILLEPFAPFINMELIFEKICEEYEDSETILMLVERATLYYRTQWKFEFDQQLFDNFNIESYLNFFHSDSQLHVHYKAYHDGHIDRHTLFLQLELSIISDFAYAIASNMWN